MEGVEMAEKEAAKLVEKDGGAIFGAPDELKSEAARVAAAAGMRAVKLARSESNGFTCYNGAVEGVAVRIVNYNTKYDKSILKPFHVYMTGLPYQYGGYCYYTLTEAKKAIPNLVSLAKGAREGFEDVQDGEGSGGGGGGDRREIRREGEMRRDAICSHRTQAG
jgi:hypothetical protein